MTKRLKDSKSFHALDESCHIVYVTETKIPLCDYFSYSLLATLSQITIETVGGVIMHGNFLNKTIIYERIIGKLLLYTLPKSK